ncbi:MAG: hypothetical protein KME09_01160 [Pleurocapsa minor HA4230-MV1]|nr:hypothetical protein [Pleurocapsa minor HA4230-MV1]
MPLPEHNTDQRSPSSLASSFARRGTGDSIKCKCGNCHEEQLYFNCPGCQQTVGYCFGGSDEYTAYCNDCWYQLTHHLVTVLLTSLTFYEKPNP